MQLWRRNSLTFRLTGTLLVALSLLLSSVAFVQVWLQDKFATDYMRTSGVSLSEGLFGALHRSMLSNDRDGLRTEVRNIAAKSGNLRVRIYNKEGKIEFSSHAQEEGQRVDMQSEACVRCHAAGRPLQRLPLGDRTREFSLDGHPALGIIRPIENEDVCWQAPCHAHAPDKRLLGVLDVTQTLGPVERNRQWTAILTLLTAAFAMAGTTAVVSSVVRKAVHAPLSRLIGTLDRLRSGDWKVRHGSEDIAEFARLSAAINDTARDLENANAELVTWAQTLERRVDIKTDELRRAQKQILQVERMASLGKLSAVVAHEINNPLASVVTYARLLRKRANNPEAPSLSDPETREILDGIASESARCGEIVSNLLLFARRSGTRVEPTQIKPLVERVLFLLKHKMDLANVRATVELGALEPVLCDPGQVEQVMVVLCVNAIEAMPAGGNLTVRTTQEPPSGVRIEVVDDGVGIAEDVLPHVFEPFFSTKDQGEGKGLGLGLSVAYGIVQHHGGSIAAHSKPGEGTRFVVVFPGQPIKGDA